MNTSPKRVLFIVNSMNVGGAETFLMKIFRKIDKRNIVFDFLINELENDFYIPEIKNLGGKIYPGYSKSKNLVKSLLAVYKVVYNNKYDIVFRMAEHPISSLDLLAAKFGGANKLIARSTNTSAEGKLSNLAAILTRSLMNIVTSVRLAPSTEAAEWIFGKKAVASDKIIILKNAIDLDVYKYNLKDREKVRKELHLENKFIIGHIGRFNTQKNHAFLIQVFWEIKKNNNNAVLLLVGQGELKKNIQHQIKQMGIQNSVIFVGMRTDIPRILSAMDILVFPSFYEGMPNVVIEAQATGLPSIISDRITKEVKLTDLVTFCSLDDDAKNWADRVLNSKKREPENCVAYQNKLKEKGYSIEESVEILENIFME